MELLEAVHAAGALAYMDGANMNAILGRFKPGAAGFDVMHFNLHKTFSTPAWRRRAGRRARRRRASDLAPFLPGPLVVRDADGSFRLERHGERPTSIGRMRAYQGSVGVLVRAYAYIRTHGGTRPAPGERRRGAGRQLPAPARRRCLRAALRRPLQARVRGHRAGRSGEATGVRTLDVAKRLIDHGFHPPTIYFPLIVDECLLIEPTETETAGGPRRLRGRRCWPSHREAASDPDLLHDGTPTTPVRRLDEATAARRPELRWRPMTGAQTPCPQ